MIEPVSLFHLASIDEGNARAALCTAEKQVATIDGTQLEAQFRCEEFFVVFATAGDPWEELLHIYLLDASHTVLDEVELGHIYTPASLKSLRARDPNAFEFSFFADEKWRLEILRKPGVVWPWKAGLAVRYPRILRRHFLVLSRAEPDAPPKRD